MELDNKWIEEYETVEQPYEDFYKESIKSVQLFFFYINKTNELEKIKEQQIFLKTENKLSRQELVDYIKSNINENKIKYSLLSILKHNIDISPDNLQKYLDTEINLQENNKYMELIPEISDIHFQDTISFLKGLNSLFIIFFESSKKTGKNMTKKIILTTKKHRKTKRKPLKKSIINYNTHT